MEEERRVLYLAMTRAKDELIITRQNLNMWATSLVDSQNRMIGSYFLSDVPTQSLPNEAGMRTFTKSSDGFESDPCCLNRPGFIGDSFI